MPQQTMRLLIVRNSPTSQTTSISGIQRMNKGPLVPPWHASPLAGKQFAGCRATHRCDCMSQPNFSRIRGVSRTQTAPLQSSLGASLADPTDSSAATCSFPISGENEQNPFQKVRLRGVKRDHYNRHRGTKPVTRSFVGQGHIPEMGTRNHWQRDSVRETCPLFWNGCSHLSFLCGDSTAPRRVGQRPHLNSQNEFSPQKLCVTPAYFYV